jgi:hypothetical protein
MQGGGGEMSQGKVRGFAHVLPFLSVTISLATEVTENTEFIDERDEG